MVTSVTRNLEDGADYRPDWRHLVVLEYLKAHAASGGRQTWEALLEGERDAVIRQVVRYHLGSSLIPEAVRYALVAQQSNANTGMATLIRAMVVADRRTGEIAEELKTKPLNILVFTRLFFDVERYLDREFWLEGLTRQSFCQGGGAEQIRERRLLRVAFERGWEGLQEALSPRKNRSAEEVKAVMEQVQHVVATRALEFVQDLQDSGMPATEADFVRYMQVMAVKSREPPPDQSGDKARDWMMEAIEREIIPPHVTEMALLGVGDDEATPGRRRRRIGPVEDSWGSKWLERKRLAEPRMDDQPEVPTQEMALETDHVEVAHGGPGEPQTGE